ncbi:hypothetical protein OE749_07030 [Aestuariibacter sp. AA17]|uniref:Uncharacterized protein n=1 Tax=Fluctibacter corallii TaxID=2984329 RepID=A0ABT3A761_9ALTE|nr:hypothetical protein [Aestuariibacter sp. AA17]MCV2884443.1 hypothetical protein [Aestuariibacter sp. AA17]
MELTKYKYLENYIEVEMPDEFRDFISQYIDQTLSDENPYLCGNEVIVGFALHALNFLKKIRKDKSSSDPVNTLLRLISESHTNGDLPVIYFTNTPEEPRDKILDFNEERGFNYALNKYDRLKESFLSEWTSWLISTLLNHDDVVHPSEHGGGNRFHLISPKEEKLRKVGASTGGGRFFQHSDGTVYTELDSEDALKAKLDELNTDIDTVANRLSKSPEDVVSEVLSGKYTRVDATILKGILNLKTKTYISTPTLLQRSLVKDGFSNEELKRLSNMPIAHIAGPADGEISGFVGEINYPIYLDSDSNIIGTCTNASEGRMKYVGSDVQDAELFEKFLATLRKMEVIEFFLKPGDLLFIPNSCYQNQPNATHGRGELDDGEYKIPVGKGRYSRRMHCRQYASSRRRSALPSLLGPYLESH